VTGKPKGTFGGLAMMDTGILSVAFSHDGDTLACSEADNTIRLWNLKALSAPRVFAVTHEGVWNETAASLIFSPDDKLLAGIVDFAVGIWNVQTGKVEKVLKGGITEGMRKLLQRSLEESGEEQPEEPAAGPWNGDIPTMLFAVAFSPDGKLMASDAGDLWDLQTGKLLRTTSGSSSVAFSPDGKTYATGGFESPEAEVMMAGGGKGAAKIWDVETGELRRQLVGKDGYRAVSVAFSGDGKTVAVTTFPAAGEGKPELGLWNADTGELLRTLPDAGCIGLISDGSTVVTGALGPDIKFWDVRTGSLTRTLKEPGGYSQLTLSGDGIRYAALGDNSDIELCDLASGKLILTLLAVPSADGKVSARDWIAYTPDGWYEGSAGVGKYIRWRVGDRLLTMQQYEAAYHRRDAGQVREVLGR